MSINFIILISNNEVKIFEYAPAVKINFPCYSSYRNLYLNQLRMPIGLHLTLKRIENFVINK